MKEYDVSYMWNGKRFTESIVANSENLAKCEFMNRILQDTTSWERIKSSFKLC